MSRFFTRITRTGIEDESTIAEVDIQMYDRVRAHGSGYPTADGRVQDDFAEYGDDGFVVFAEGCEIHTVSELTQLVNLLNGSNKNFLPN